MVQYHNARRLAQTCHPDEPVLLRRPHLLDRAARFFLEQFPGNVFYAVKANPDPWILRGLWQAGVRRFDVASITEVRTAAATVPQAELAFMHPIKPASAIKEAYEQHGVRIFAVDSVRELSKLEEETGGAEDLTICVRLRVPSKSAAIPLASKFGADEASSSELLANARRFAHRLGIAFHVGSQTSDPAAYANAMDLAARAVRRAGVIVDVLDVGGGFPTLYPDRPSPLLSEYFSTIARNWPSFPSASNAELWCEPGRALVAEAESLLVRVDDRRDHCLYINDGGFGALYDAVNIEWLFPAILCRHSDRDLVPFKVYGPTCDDADCLQKPLELPSDIDAGDYIEIGTVGAYGRAMATGFNGYGRYTHAELTDDPFPSLFATGAAQDGPMIAEENR